MSNFEKSQKNSLQIFEVLVIDDVGVINHFVQFHFLYSTRQNLEVICFLMRI